MARGSAASHHEFKTNSRGRDDLSSCPGGEKPHMQHSRQSPSSLLEAVRESVTPQQDRGVTVSRAAETAHLVARAIETSSVSHRRTVTRVPWVCCASFSDNSTPEQDSSGCEKNRTLAACGSRLPYGHTPILDDRAAAARKGRDYELPGSSVVDRLLRCGP